MSNSKNDIAWGKIFEKYKIIDAILLNGSLPITSNQINEFREARLMTKFDHKSQLPKLFSDHKLSILPTSRGGYIIGNFQTFQTFNDDDVAITRIPFPTYLQSLDYKDITSEATAINCAFVTGILSDFTAEKNLYPTVSGRMSSSSFSFNVDSANGLFEINVGNAQVEIDGGYEGDFSLNLIEAKNYISDDFLIRQLYYPYKLWVSKVDKKVRPIFLTYTNGIFHLREYAFEDINHYNSLKLVKQKKYAVDNSVLTIEIIQSILSNQATVEEPEIPFPQADSFERIINLCELLKQKVFITKEEITQNYDFDSRQTDYYSNAGKYLGLIESRKENEQIGCFLTDKGQRIFDLSIGERQIEFIKLILSHKAFKDTLKRYLDGQNAPNKEEVVRIMKGSSLYKLDSEVTYFRRASTITRWINWILKQIEA